MSRNTVQRPIASLLAHSENANELLPHLHQHALDVTGGICSLLFRHNPRTGDLQATAQKLTPTARGLFTGTSSRLICWWTFAATCGSPISA